MDGKDMDQFIYKPKNIFEDPFDIYHHVLKGSRRIRGVMITELRIGERRRKIMMLYFSIPTKKYSTKMFFVEVVDYVNSPHRVASGDGKFYAQL